ncbi:conserved hypothetical protein [Talaromyces stipitatus ATCC 10500]|uniref:mRNA stability protein n=1 Tax=Talaromyces stipitatus (strain ATCC 10500 / CBS 375.48 / QM 6759 / NRRL 1006) TaxID=441959 RepID=B8LZS5_TALSN|nr:uncharacterized protein TSTA_080900 [Talaromyces stipitatus ATCC 10500]EED20857.1 conserved hypothetical protein [Talaromyces stipitatus ATCC 10500]
MEKSDLPSETARRICQVYGRAPGGLAFQHKSQKERKYFDSGDFALTATGKTTDNGVLNTGETHPRRSNISRPHASVPGNSNVQEDANETLQDRKSSDFVMTKSPLHQHTDQQSKKSARPKSHEAI